MDGWREGDERVDRIDGLMMMGLCVIVISIRELLVIRIKGDKEALINQQRFRSRSPSMNL